MWYVVMAGSGDGKEGGEMLPFSQMHGGIHDIPSSGIV